MKARNRVILLVALLGVMAGGYTLIQSKQKALKEEPTAYVHTHIPMVIQNNQADKTYELYSAKLEAKENPKLSTKISGYIEKIYVKENQKVKKGDILASIDASEYDNSLKQLQYSLEAAQMSVFALQKTIVFQKLDTHQALKTFNTNKKIFAAGGISQDQLNLSEIAYEQKQANYLATLDQIKSKEFTLKSQEALFKSKKSLERYYTIVAPFDGVVQSVYLSHGDLTQGGKPILSLLSYTQKMTFVYANDSIKIGQKVYMQESVIGFIEKIYPSAQKYLKMAEIKLFKPLNRPYNSLISIEVDTK